MGALYVDVLSVTVKEEKSIVPMQGPQRLVENLGLYSALLPAYFPADQAINSKVSSLNNALKSRT